MDCGSKMSIDALTRLILVFIPRVSNHRQLDCSCDSFSGQNEKKSELRDTGPLWVESTGNRCIFPRNRPTVGEKRCHAMTSPLVSGVLFRDHCSTPQNIRKTYGSWLVVFCCGYSSIGLPITFRVISIGIGSIIWVPPCHWSTLEECEYSAYILY